MKKIIIVVLALPLAGWLGFQLWLQSQPEDFRAMIRGMPPAEFARVVHEHFSPPPAIDRAGFGRRDYPDRGHSPWVLRSNLDDHPRILNLALAPGYWLSYHTSIGLPYQFWRGDIDFTGPVYDTRHGGQPRSRGDAFFRFEPSKINWLMKIDGVWQPASFDYLGHSLLDDGRIARLNYQISHGDRRVALSETPDYVKRDPMDGLRRVFAIHSNPTGVPVSVVLPDMGTGQETDGTIVAGVPSWLQMNEHQTTITHWFSDPQIDLNLLVAEQPADSTDILGSSDCLSCHNAQEKVVGPSWHDIALRYGDAPDRAAVVADLAAKIINGSAGSWGAVPMTPHADLDRATAERMVVAILQVGEDGAAEIPPRVAAFRKHHEYSWDFSSEQAPESLHPALSVRPLEIPGFEPAVGGLTLIDDSRLVVASWDRDGAVFVVDGWQSDQTPRATRIAEGLHEPLGLASVDGELYVMQKQELTRLIDHDGDGQIDEYRVLSDDWQASSNFHEFGFGLAARDGWLYGGLSACVLNGGKSCPDQLDHRGRIIRVEIASGKLEMFASGLRTPNGITVAESGDIYVTDNQGDWLPSSKLLHVTRGSFHGWRPPADRDRAMPVPKPPVLWLPQNEVGNSPTEPVVLVDGPYAGQIIFGDIYNGGIKRANLQRVDGVLQGAVFHFSGGLQGGVNRLLPTPNGDIVVGQIGNPGNWGEFGKRWYGLEVIRFTGETAFEPYAMTAIPGGFEVALTQPLAADSVIDGDDIVIKQWLYFPSQMYGGPKYDLTALRAKNVQLSDDRRRLRFAVKGLKPDHVVYLQLPRSLKSAAGEALWVNEAWYTLNRIPTQTAKSAKSAKIGKPDSAAGGDAAGSGDWQTLFDGKSFDGWRNYGAAPGTPVRGWAIEDGTLKMTRDTSFLVFVLNFLNPFSDTPLLDLMTERKFSDFELSIDWKISPGGNSGIFYLVPDDKGRVPWKLGLEMQVLDNDGHDDGRIITHRAGDLYDLKASSSEPVKPVGEWNTAVIRVKGDHIQHFLNGVKVVDVMRSGPEWDAMLANSKFAGREGYGQAKGGHIVLQDHGDHVWYRNIKIRELR